MKEVRIIIAGSRTFNDYQYLQKFTLEVIEKVSLEYETEYCEKLTKEQIKIISGRAKGADQLGERFGEEYGYQIELFPADWEKNGKEAGFIRNSIMGNCAIADDNIGVLIAFWDGQSKGTLDMIKKAKLHRMNVYVANFKEDTLCLMKKPSSL